MSLVFVAAAAACVSLGCSEPVPPASQGAFYASFVQQSAIPDTSCAVKAHNTQVGGLDQTKLNVLLKDTLEGAVIFCNVIGGGTFDADGHVEKGASLIEFFVKGMSKAATKDSPVEGTVTFASQETAGSYSSGSPPDAQPCKFWIEGQEQIAAGRAWMSFTCPALSQAPAKTNTCAINYGYVAVQNCEQ